MSRAGRTRDADEAPRVDGRRLVRLGLPILAAWIVPGLGHALLGRMRRAALFFVLVGGAFTLGLAHDGRLALRTPDQPLLTSLQVIANLGVGPSDTIARIVVYDGPVYSVRDPVASRSLARLRDRSRSQESNYGTAYLWTAGLMNLLLLFDVWDIGRGRKD